MNEQDLKYLIAAYQQKSFDIFTQLVASEARIKNLTDVIETLKNKISELSDELKKSKSKIKVEDDFS